MSQSVRDRSACAAVRLLGADTEVMCADGRVSRYERVRTGAWPDSRAAA